MQSERRILDQVRDFLGRRQPVSLEALRELAVEYAELARAVNLRLEECAAHLAQGRRSEARHLAESRPPLLDLSRMLLAEDLLPWQDACLEHEISEPAPIRRELVDMLEFAIEDADEATREVDRLLALYRRVTLIGQTRERVQVLRAIRDADPGNEQWADDLRALEARRLNEIETEFHSALGVEDEPALEWLVAELSSPAWLIKPPRATRKTLEARYEAVRMKNLPARASALAGEVSRALEEGDASAVEKALQRWVEIEGQSGFAPVPGLVAAVESARSWLSAQRSLEAVENAIGGAPGPEALEAALVEARRRVAALPEELAGRAEARLGQMCRASRKRSLVRAGVGAGAVALAILLVAIPFRACSEARARTEALERIDGFIDADDWEGAGKALDEALSERPGLAETGDFMDRQERITRVLGQVAARRKRFRDSLARIDLMAEAGYEPFQTSRAHLEEAKGLAQGEEDKGEWNERRRRIDEAERARRADADDRAEALLAEAEAVLAALVKEDHATDLSRLQREVEIASLKIAEAKGIEGVSASVRERFPPLEEALESVRQRHQHAADGIRRRREEWKSLYAALPDLDLYERALGELANRRDLPPEDAALLDRHRAACPIYREVLRSRDWPGFSAGGDLAGVEAALAALAEAPDLWQGTMNALREDLVRVEGIRERFRGELKHLLERPYYAQLRQFEVEFPERRIYYCKDAPEPAGSGDGAWYFYVKHYNESLDEKRIMVTYRRQEVELTDAAHSRYLRGLKDRSESTPPGSFPEFVWSEIQGLAGDPEIHPIVAMIFARAFLRSLAADESSSFAPFRDLQASWERFGEFVPWTIDTEKVRTASKARRAAFGELPDLAPSLRRWTLRRRLEAAALSRKLACVGMVERDPAGGRLSVRDEAASEAWIIDRHPDRPPHFLLVARKEGEGSGFVERPEAGRYLVEGLPLYAPSDGLSTVELARSLARGSGLTEAELADFEDWPEVWPENEIHFPEDH